MALRLRRGTDAQRQLITPLEGELIFATDTKLLYAGDGTTAGGVAVTGAGGGGVTTLQLLTDTDISAPEDNQVLTYNSGTSKWVAANNSGAGSLGLNDLSNVFIGGDLYAGDILMCDGAGNFQPQSFTDFFDEQQNYKINIVGDDSTIILNTDNNALNGSTITATTGFVGDVTGDITGNVTGNLTGNAAGAHTGTLDGDVSGSVFGDDSSILVDGINNTISCVSLGATQINTSDITATIADNVSVKSHYLVVENFGGTGSNADATTIGTEISRGTSAAPATMQVGDYLGVVTMAAYNGTAMAVKSQIATIVDTVTGTNTLPTKMALTIHDFNSGYTTSATLDSRGTFEAPTFKAIPYADAAARDAQVGTAEAGMIIYLTDTNKLQCYNGTAWTNLF